MQLIHRLYAIVSQPTRRRRRLWLEREMPIAGTPTILDIGGYPWCWPDAGAAERVTLLNLEFAQEHRAQYPQFRFVTADACLLPFGDAEFALVHSNSVIEHVGTWERQLAFAREARRAGRKLWIQTPAREFFIEPHLLAPFIHWLPIRIQRHLIRWVTLWGWLTRPTPAQVDAFLAEVRLITRSEMEHLFPDCEILTERFLGMPKSYIAIRRHG